MSEMNKRFCIALASKEVGKVLTAEEMKQILGGWSRGRGRGFYYR